MIDLKNTKNEVCSSFRWFIQHYSNTEKSLYKMDETEKKAKNPYGSFSDKDVNVI